MLSDLLDPIRTALAPRSIAIIGASENRNKVGGRPIEFLKRFGFAGRIHPINPGRDEVQGVPCASSIRDLAEAPDVAIVAVAGQAAVDAVEACAAAGVRLAIVMAAGFGEVDPIHGKLIEERMVATARSRGMRIVGPNSQGLANFGSGAITSFSTMFLESPLPADGPVGIVSQSGAIAASVYGMLRQKGIGVRHVHATGNDCDVTTCELASVVAEDPELRLLLLYLEGLPDPEQLSRAASIARERELPIIAVKSGRTLAGQVAARTHTGALSSEDRIVGAFLEHCGIRRASCIAEMIEGVDLYLKKWRPVGHHLVALTTSGATGVMIADATSSADLQLARLATETVHSLREVLPPIATAANPLDLTGALLTDNDLFVRALDAVSRDPLADSLLIGITVAGSGYDVDKLALATSACATETAKPVVVAAPQVSVMERFRHAGVPVFQFETAAVQALGAYIAHHDLIRSALESASSTGSWSPPPLKPRLARTSVLSEASSLAFLAARQVPVASHHLCRTEEDVLRAFDDLGGPVAVKGCSSEVAHKSELGIVKLDVRDREEALVAYREIVDTFDKNRLSCEGVLVARMVMGQRELMIGVHNDSIFGHVVLVGDGGKYLEALPDVQVMISPVTAKQVRKALSRLRIAPLFAGVRGEPPMDVDAFVEAVVRVDAIVSSGDLRIESIDMNPVVVGAAGAGCSAVDAVIVIAENSGNQEEVV